MKMRNSLACLVAAVTCVSISSVQAVDLTWDASGSGDPAVTDGSGNWDLVNNTWFDGATNVVWSNGNSAIFGGPDNIFNTGAEQFNIDLAAAITAQDLTIGIGANGGGYTFSDFGGGSLTLNGNVHKTGGGGVIQFLNVSGPITLGAGAHTFQIRDTGGDASEITVNASLTGSGGVALNNNFYEAWGTLGLTQANSYTGATTITKGRLVITDSGALGSTSTGTTIGNLGTLGLGGGGLTPAGEMNISEPITINRSVYEGGDFGIYGTAIANNEGNNTLSGPITLNTADARFAINNGNSNLTVTTNLTSAGKVSIIGSGPGAITFSGNNTGVAGGFNIRGGSLAASNHNNIGGVGKPIIFGSDNATPGGDGFLRIVGGFMTDFSQHPFNPTTFSGGIDTPDASQVFNIAENLTGNQINKRGLGTLNLSGTNVMTGDSWIDLGTINIGENTSTTVGSVQIRNGTLKINAGTTYITTKSVDNRVGVDNTETGNIIQTGGSVSIGSATGRANLTLGAFGQDEVNVRTGNYTMSGGTLYVSNEFMVGSDRGSRGNLVVSGNSAITVDGWFQVGRFGADSTLDVSGTATVTKTGASGGNAYIGERPWGEASARIHGNARYTVVQNEFWIAQDQANATVTVDESGTLEVLNGWFAVGREGGIGVLNIKDNGTVTKAGNDFIEIGSFTGGKPQASTGTVNQTGGTFSAVRTRLGADGIGVYNLSAGSANFGSVFEIGRYNGGGNTPLQQSYQGTLNISGTGAAVAGAITMGGTENASQTVPGTINLTSGSLTATSVAHGPGTGVATFNFTAGTLSVGAYSLPGVLSNTGTGKLAPGGLGTAAATTITNGYTQGATASMAIDLGGSAAGAFDSVASTGPVALDGVLNLALVGGYDPTLLQTHTIVSASALTGKFKTVTGVRYAAQPNRGLAVTYSGTEVKVTAARLGDTDLSGAVNFDDLLTLAQNYGGTSTSWATGDFDGTGTTVFDDLLALAQNYGLSGVALPTDLGTSVSSAFAADWTMALSLVPEPTSLSVLGLGGLALSRSRRR